MLREAHNCCHISTKRPSDCRVLSQIPMFNFLKDRRRLPLTFFRVDFHSRVIFTFVNKIEAMYEKFEST